MNPELRELYTYTTEERAMFSYIDTYSSRVSTPYYFNRVTPTGYALAGLFLTDRACNHTGAEMTTQVFHNADPSESRSAEDHIDSVTWLRLQRFPELTGLSIHSQSQYIAMARIFPAVLLYSCCLHRLLLRISQLKFPPI